LNDAENFIKIESHFIRVFASVFGYSACEAPRLPPDWVAGACQLISGFRLPAADV